MERREEQPHYLPTPEEIAAQCAEFQAGWTAQQRQRRKPDKPLEIDDVVYPSREFFGGHRGPEGT